MIEAKDRLIRYLENSDPDLLECIRGPMAWTSRESGSSAATPMEKIANFKSLFLLWLEREYNFLHYLPPSAKLSMALFDDFWIVRRLIATGDMSDLQAGVVGKLNGDACANTAGEA